MNPALIVALVQIIATQGIPIAQQIWQWTQKKEPITQADWDKLNELAQYKSSDALTAAGIKIVNGVVVKLDGSPFP